MARIRTIKPELPQSETIGRLSRDARLLFIQLFTIADDAGRARASSRLLASLLYPYDDDAGELIDGWLTELERHKAIRRYGVEGTQYLEIIKWLEHQKIDRPSASRLPAFVEASTNTREQSRGSDADLGPSTSTLDHIPQTADAGVSAFEDFWKVYPNRDGDNPKLPAKIKFDALVKTGVDPQIMIGGAQRYADEMKRKGQAGTQYVAHALKWLSQQRWADIAAAAFVADLNIRPQHFVEEGSFEWGLWQQESMRLTRRGTPIIDQKDDSGHPTGRRGWYFKSRVPEGLDEQTGERLSTVENSEVNVA